MSRPLRLAAALAMVVIASSCSRPDRGGEAGSQAWSVASGELPTASADRPQQLPTPWVASAEPSAQPAPAASVAQADSGIADDKGPVRLGAVTVTGSLTNEVIGKTIRAQMPKLRQCYDKSLAANPGQKGRLKVRLAIDREGAVTTAVNGGSDVSEELVGCVLRAFWSMKFPAPKDGIVLAVVPLKFGVQ